jgi:sugar phosphate isomerase/epimerase
VAWRTSMATSPAPSVFGPLLFAGDLGRAIEAAAALGFEGIEISLRSTAEVDAGRLEEQLQVVGLALSALGSGRAFLEEGLCFADPDDGVRRAAVARIREHITLAGRFGALVIIGLIRGARPADGGAEAADRRIVRCLRECAEAAGEAGVGLVVEAINRYETAFYNTAEDALQLLDAVGSSRAGVLLDVFHMNIEEVSIAGAVRAAGSRLHYFHIVDSNRWAPGWGHVDYSDVGEALRSVGYAGWVSAEILPRPDALAAARQARTFVAGWATA